MDRQGSPVVEISLHLVDAKPSSGDASPTFSVDARKSDT